MTPDARLGAGNALISAAAFVIVIAGVRDAQEILVPFLLSVFIAVIAIPAVLLAFVQLGSGAPLWSLAGYLLVNGLVGNLIEPRFMGRGLGLSTLVVFLSLVFWGWVLGLGTGLVGMFLSVPLTMAVRIALDSRENTRWIAVLLGPELKQH